MIPIVRRALQSEQDTQNIWNKPDELDKYFKCLQHKIFAIVTCSRVQKMNALTSQQLFDFMAQYPFANVPIKRKYVWIFDDDSWRFKRPIDRFGLRGNFGLQPIHVNADSSPQLKKLMKRMNKAYDKKKT